MAPAETYSSFTTTSNVHEHDSHSRTTHSHRTHGYGRSLQQESTLPPPPHMTIPPQPNYSTINSHHMHTPSPNNHSRQRTRSSPSPPPHSHLPYKNGKRPSLASPLPPSPLVPPAPDMAKRFMPAPLNLASSPTSSSPYQHHRRPGTAGSQTGSISGMSSPPVSPRPSPPHELHGHHQYHQHHAHPHPAASKASSTNHAQYVTVQARPYTANGSLPESPSTAAMMKRLLAKPAPVGAGGGSTSGGLTSGSESEGWTSGGMGYVRRKVESSSPQIYGLGHGQVQGEEAKEKDKVKRKPSVLRRRASANNTSVNAASGSASSSKAPFHSNSHSNATSPRSPISSGGSPPSLPPPPIFSPLSLSPLNGPSTPFLIPPASSSSVSHPTSEPQTTLGAGPIPNYTQSNPHYSHPANLSSSSLSSPSHSTSRSNSDSRRPDHFTDGANATNSHNHNHNHNLNHNRNHNNCNQSHQAHQHQTHTHSHQQQHHPPSSHNTAAARTSTLTVISPRTHDGATGRHLPASNSFHPSSVSVSHRRHNNQNTVTNSTSGKNFSQSGHSQGHRHGDASSSGILIPIPPLPSSALSSSQSSSSKAMQRSLSASAVLPAGGGGSGSVMNRKGRQLEAVHSSPSHPNSPGTTSGPIKPPATPKKATVTSMLDSLRPPLPHHAHIQLQTHSQGSSTSPSPSASASRGSSRTRGSRTSSPPRSPVLSSFTNTNAGSNSNSLTVVPSLGHGSIGTPSPTSFTHSSQKERDKEKEKERGRSSGATPAASLIEAYKRQEKEREEREKERAARRQREEEARRSSRTAGQRMTMMPGIGLGGSEGVIGVAEVVLPKAHSQPSSRRHSFSLLSPERGSSSVGGSAATSTSGSPVATVRRTVTASAAVTTTSALTGNTSSAIDKNLLSVSDALQRRKDVHSYASEHTTDSAQDLINHVHDDEAHTGATGSERGFEAIERMVESCAPSIKLTTTAQKDDDSKVVSSSSSPSVTQPHTPNATSEPSRESMLARPYYTVVGTSSGRVVTAGSREDASLSSYGMGYWESGVMSRQAQAQVQAERAEEKGRDKEKEKMSIGRSLTRKMSGRWKKQGGVVVGTLNSPLVGEDEGRGRLLGRGSMQEKRVYAAGNMGGGAGVENSTRSMSRSRSRPRQEVDEDERRMKLKNRRSLRLSIDKFDDRLPQRHGSNADVSDGEAEIVETAVMAETGTKLKKAQKHESSPSATASPGGSKIWRLMKRISIGSGLKEKFHDSGGGDSPPPVPALPKNAHTLHASRSTDSSFKNGSNSKIGSKGSSSASSSPTQAVNGRYRYVSSPVTDTPPAARSSSKPPASPLTTTVTTAALALPPSTSIVASAAPAAPPTSAQTSQPRQSTTPRSSSPVFSSSSDVGSSRFFYRTLSARSSTSSLGLGEQPPPMPSKPLAILGQHIIAPSELRKVDAATGYVGDSGDVAGFGEKSSNSKRALPPKSIPIPIPRPTLSRRPSTAGGHAGDLRQLQDDDWMIVKSPDVELPSLPLPPPRRVTTLPSTPTFPSSSGADTPADAATATGAAGTAWDSLDDVDEMSEGDGSPIIPMFSTEEPANLFPARRASASTTLSPTSTRRLASSPTSPFPSASASSGSHSAENEPKSATASLTGGVGIGFGSSSPPRLPPLGLSAGLNLGSPSSPPPPRPQRSSHRPPPPPSSIAGSPPSAASTSTTGGTVAVSVAVSPPSSAVLRSQILSPRVVDDIPVGRKSESHAVRPLMSPSRHNAISQRRSISTGSPSLSLSLSSNSNSNASSSSRPGTGASHTQLHRSASSFVVLSTMDAGTDAEYDREPSDRDPDPDLDTDLNLDDGAGGGDKDKSVAKKKFALTEQEKAERWADLLERSEKAGGTLRVEVGGLAGLGGGLKRGLGFR